MKRSIFVITAGAAVALSLFASAKAGSLEQGAAAYERADYAAALQLLRPLAERGDGAAANYLGDIYYNGLGVARDNGEALLWSRKAADLGFAEAQNNLGSMYFSGRGVTKDPVQAANWFQAAASRGSPDGQFNLGVLYDTGQGVTQSPLQARIWYRRAAAQGQPAAQFKLGLIYRDGVGVPADPVQAYGWLSLAAAAEGAAKGEASAERDALSAQLTADQRRQAEQWARDWTPSNTATGAPPARQASFVSLARFSGSAWCGSAGPFTPNKACRKGVSGVGVLDCSVSADGVVQACSMVSETPAGFGFSAAALEMAKSRAITAEPRFVNGQAVADEDARVVVTFNNPKWE